LIGNLMEIPHSVKVIPKAARLPERPAYPHNRLRSLYRALSLPLLAFLALPLVALLTRAMPTDILSNLRQPQVVQAILLSLNTTLVAPLLTILFGTPLAYALARGLLPFQRLIDTLIDLPTVLPPAVAGLALLMVFGRRGLLGGWISLLGIQIAFTPLAVVLAQTFIAAPFFIKAATVGFSSIDTELEQAAGLDGANTWQIFRFVIVPLSWSALLSGSVMTWARALGEFGATIIFAGNFPGRTQTMPLAIYLGFELNLDVALALSVILVGFSFLVLLILKVVLQRDQP
jgi:molybdate transport system permease protein